MADRFCPACGGELELRHVDADSRARQVCKCCSVVHYRNPRILVTAMVTCGARLLLCRRSHEPARGLWTPPSGFMELDETLEQAAARETWEETGVTISVNRLMLYTVTNLPALGEVYVSFKGQSDSDDCVAGPESLEADFFREEQIPWDRLAYPEMIGYLRMFFRELTAGETWIHLSQADRGHRERRGYRVIEVKSSIKSTEY